MAVVEETVSLSTQTVARVQQALRAAGIGGWLLFNFRAVNPIAAKLLGLPPALTRRYFVLIPAQGTPIALTHPIEQGPWRGWIGEKRTYDGWRGLETELKRLLDGVGTVAMEHSPGNAVPTVDYVPGGVLDLVRGAGVEVVSSAELVSAFYSPWSEADAASHRRSARVLHRTVHEAFARVAHAVRAGETMTEWDLRRWVEATLHERGVKVGTEAIVAVNANAANPHYAPTAEESAPIVEGDLLLIDLFGKETEDSVYADQTWMAFVGAEIPERIQGIWEVLRTARDTALALLRDRWAAGRPLTGAEVDDAARGVIEAAGYGPNFIHRTGHSIDRGLHGSGPNIDNQETRDVRGLVPGVGFSIEPGIYLPGDLGFRTEVDVFVGPDGPEVTTPEPQHDLYALLRDGGR